MSRLITFLVLLCLVALTACNQGGVATPLPASPTIDTQATVEAAIAATSSAQAAAATAQAGMQATIEAAVAATQGAQPPTPTAGQPVEYVEMSEEELEALINQAVNEAVAASTTASEATVQASADSTITQEEIDSLESLVASAEQALFYANELIEAYDALYAALAVDSVQALVELEQELAAVTESLTALTQALTEVEAALTQGQAIAQATLDQLTAAAQQVSDLQQIAGPLQQWLNQAQRDRENRVNQILAIQPDAGAPQDLLGTLSAAFSFVDEIRNALGDNQLSRDELNRIAQLGANASAGLKAHGGLQLQELSSKVSEILAQLARGQVPQARRGLAEFERSLGARPPNLPRPGLRP